MYIWKNIANSEAYHTKSQECPYLSGYIIMCVHIREFYCTIVKTLAVIYFK